MLEAEPVPSADGLPAGAAVVRVAVVGGAALSSVAAGLLDDTPGRGVALDAAAGLPVLAEAGLPVVPAGVALDEVVRRLRAAVVRPEAPAGLRGVACGAALADRLRGAGAVVLLEALAVLAATVDGLPDDAVSLGDGASFTRDGRACWPAAAFSSLMGLSALSESASGADCRGFLPAVASLFFSLPALAGAGSSAVLRAFPAFAFLSLVLSLLLGG